MFQNQNMNIWILNKFSIKQLAPNLFLLFPYINIYKKSIFNADIIQFYTRIFIGKHVDLFGVSDCRYVRPSYVYNYLLIFCICMALSLKRMLKFYNIIGCSLSLILIIITHTQYRIRSYFNCIEGRSTTINPLFCFHLNSDQNTYIERF